VSGLSSALSRASRRASFRCQCSSSSSGPSPCSLSALLATQILRLSLWYLVHAPLDALITRSAQNFPAGSRMGWVRHQSLFMLRSSCALRLGQPTNADMNSYAPVLRADALADGLRGGRLLERRLQLRVGALRWQRADAGAGGPHAARRPRGRRVRRLRVQPDASGNIMLLCTESVVASRVCAAAFCNCSSDAVPGREGLN